MKNIENASDVSEFVGKVVAFEANAKYFKGHKDKEVRFAHIKDKLYSWDTGEKGYNLTRFLLPSERNGRCALTDSMLSGAGVRMRLATNAELRTLKGRVSRREEMKEYHSHSMEKTMELLTSAMRTQ